MSVITISRQFGAGGKTIGEMVSRKLGYLFFDDQIIQMIAARARVSPGWVKSIEREAGGMLQKFILSVGRKSFAERISEEGGYIDEEIYIDLLNT
ncbi:MAG: cytidylate kinase family protein [Deltaproteobacteria bacterium]|nr:cytidylate kinase family protein [Deltaproteobacteria bacterium]